METENFAAFPNLINLAAEKLGAKVLLASDDFFGEKENLLKPGRGVFLPDKYTERGKWVDGWESRRKRKSGNDWAIIHMAMTGQIHAVDIDTNHFLGNHAPYASLEAAHFEGESPSEKVSTERILWKEIIPLSPLKPGSQNLFTIKNNEKWTHLRLNIYPDGGVARLRVWGKASFDWNGVKRSDLIDLAALKHGGKALICSDMFFRPMDNLLQGNLPVNMEDGWETRRKRALGHDWIILKLGHPGMMEKIDVNTTFYKGNAPDRCSLQGCWMEDGNPLTLSHPDAPWVEVLPESKLEADSLHSFSSEIKEKGPFTHAKLNIYPDGGLSRLAIWGYIYKD